MGNLATLQVNFLLMMFLFLFAAGKERALA